MYDWANSAFATTILAAILPVYFASLVPEDGIPIRLGPLRMVASASGLWAYGVSFSLLVTALAAPVLGAVADVSRAKKRFLLGFTNVGAALTSLLYFIESGDWWPCLALFVGANIGFAGSMPFYNAFLPEISREGEMDWISGKGYAFGYVGGGLLLALHVLFITYHEIFGIQDSATSVRISLGSVGVWWALFSVPLFLWVPEPRPLPKRPENLSCLKCGLVRLLRTLRAFREYRDLLWFLVAFLVYNDGIQTVIAMAAIFGKTALGLSTGTLIGTLLLTQLIALPGALFFAKVAQRVGSKGAIMMTLLLWSGVVAYAYFLTAALEFWILGGLVGLVLGGSQAISRSLYGQLIPKGRAAEFFGFFAISNKFSSIFGPLIFGLITDLSDNPRNAIVSVLGFFLIGMILLSQLDLKRGIQQATL